MERKLTRKRPIITIESSSENDEEKIDTKKVKRQESKAKPKTLKTRKRKAIKSDNSDEEYQEVPVKKEKLPKNKQVKATTSDLQSDSSDEKYQEVPVKKEKLAQNKKVKATTSNLQPTWEDYEIILQEHDVHKHIAENIVKLFQENNTIPFIARYRKAETGNMNPEDLRDVKESYEKAQALKARMQAVLKLIEKTGNMTSNLKNSILNSNNIETLEHLYAPYKVGTAKSLVERAKALGLEKPAMNILENICEEDLQFYAKLNGKDLDISDVEKGIVHIMAHVIATHADTLKFLDSMKKETNFMIETKRKAVQDKTKNTTKGNTKGIKKLENSKKNDSKFSLYFDFKKPIKFMKPHQILAINRGENLKELQVKIEIPDFLRNKFKYFCVSNWLNKGTKFSSNRKRLIEDAIKDCYERIVTPLIKRQLRADLKSKAEKASMEVFNSNLKQILLAAPVKGKKILGIDPGFTHGCKCALISETGAILFTTVLHLHSSNHESNDNVLQKLLIKHSCTIIAIGNGTACRETERWISDLITQNVFKPLDVTYTIVSECGASIYSCSKEAKKEFADLDPNLISAVSLARRIQDPLSELVKIEPKHLGVGMYQHDLSSKKLEETLNEVVSECVSFVGVDLNTSSQCLLRHIAGLSDKRATEIVNFREKNGSFKCREDLKKVKGIGDHTFQQCVGFLKIVLPDQGTSINKLDNTIIHPESYNIALNIMKKVKVKSEEIGSSQFIDKIKKEQESLTGLYESYETTKENMIMVVDALCKPNDYDLRDEISNRPLFKTGITNFADLKLGQILTGRVENVTNFGYFTDIGVGCNGLIHVSQAKGENLQIGDSVEVRVINLEVDRKRIGLALLKNIK